MDEKYGKTKKLYIFNWICFTLFLWTFFYLLARRTVMWVNYFTRFNFIWVVLIGFDLVQSEGIVYLLSRARFNLNRPNPKRSDPFKLRDFETVPKSDYQLWLYFLNIYFNIRTSYHFNEQQKEDFRNWW